MASFSSHFFVVLANEIASKFGVKPTDRLASPFSYDRHESTVRTAIKRLNSSTDLFSSSDLLWLETTVCLTSTFSLSLSLSLLVFFDLFIVFSSRWFLLFCKNKQTFSDIRKFLSNEQLNRHNEDFVRWPVCQASDALLLSALTRNSSSWREGFAQLRHCPGLFINRSIQYHWKQSLPNETISSKDLGRKAHPLQMISCSIMKRFHI